MRHNVAARTVSPSAILVGDGPDLDKLAGELDRRFPVVRYGAAEIDLAVAKIAQLAKADMPFAVTADESNIGITPVQALETAINAVPDKYGKPQAFLTILSASKTQSSRVDERIAIINTLDRKVKWEPSTGDRVIDDATLRAQKTLSAGSIPAALLLSIPATGFEGNVAANAAAPNSTEQKTYLATYRERRLSGYPFNQYEPDMQKSAARLAAPIQVLICDTGDWNKPNCELTQPIQQVLQSVGIPAQYFPATAIDVLMASLAKIREEDRQAVVIDMGAMGWYRQAPFKEDSFLRLVEKAEPRALRLFVRDPEFGGSFRATEKMNPAIISAAAQATFTPTDKEKYTVWRDVVKIIEQLTGLDQQAAPSRSARMARGTKVPLP